MCQATVYLDDEKIMEDVIWLEPTEGGFLLRTFFEEPQEVKAKLKSIDLLEHRVSLTSVGQGQGGHG
jgi:predicted RNA-binding protein